MPDENQNQNTNQPTKFAGKYETPDALAAGFKELHGKLNLPELPKDKPLVGANGVFADTAALEYGYKSFESMLGRAPKGGDPSSSEKPKPDEGTLSIPKETPPTTLKGTAGILAKAGLTGKEAELAEQWKANGKFTPEQYAGLAKAGFDEEAANEWAAGVQARAEQATTRYSTALSEAATLVGGEDKLRALVKQAKDFVPANEQADFDARLADPKRLKGAVRELMAMHQEAVGAGKSQALIGGTKPVSSGAITSAKEFREVGRLANQGDAAALARLNATSPEDCARFMNV